MAEEDIELTYLELLQELSILHNINLVLMIQLVLNSYKNPYAWSPKALKLNVDGPEK